MSNIKEKIGQRILEERKAKGLTRKALAELTEDLKPSRINNWERGLRTPGPEEIKQLAEALDIAPGYLMCLTEEKETKREFPWLGALVPILTTEQACDPKRHIQAIRDDQDNPSIAFMPLGAEISENLGEYAFALCMKDDSMKPELIIGDFLIVDPEQIIQPGELVVARINEDSEVTIRRYKQLSATKSIQEYELIPTNENWASIKSSQHNEHKLIGPISMLIRLL